MILTMRPKERRESGQTDLFRARLDQIVDMTHALVTLARTIDWGFLETRFGALYDDDPGRPPLPTRLMAGLAILKHLHDLSDEASVRALAREPVFPAVLWRGVLSAPAAVRALVADALAPAHGRGAAAGALAGEPVRRHPHRRGQARRLHPGDRRHHRAGEGDHLPDRRQADAPGARAPGAARKGSTASACASPMPGSARSRSSSHQRYAHAKQFKRANRALRRMRTMLGRVIRDITRKIDGNESLERCLRPAALARPARQGPAPARAGPEGLQPARARGGMHRQGQGAQALRVRREGLASPRRCSAAGAASSWRMCRRCRATLTMGIRSPP